MRFLVALLALVVLFACKRTEDEAARQRIFSQEPMPAAGSTLAKEPLDAAALASDPKLLQRVLHMSQAEIGQRIGAHRAQQRVQFAWFGGAGLADGGSEVSHSEETTVLDAPGDDFSVRLVNDHNQGFEMLWVKGEVFVKSLYGPFHKRRTDRS